MTRDDIKSFFDEAEKVERAIGGLLHRDAQPALTALQAMRDIVGEELPGGYYGTCIGCDEVKGEDEMVSCGDENLCSDCVKQAEEDYKAGERQDRMPGTDPKTGEYSTAQMLADEMTMGDTTKPLFD